MPKFLGEEILKPEESSYKHFNQTDWAKFWIEEYGQIDGGHHKMWAIDQVQRILCGTKVIVSFAEWDDGTCEYRFNLDEPTEEYLKFVKDYENDGEYHWDIGIAP